MEWNGKPFEVSYLKTDFWTVEQYRRHSDETVKNWIGVPCKTKDEKEAIIEKVEFKEMNEAYGFLTFRYNIFAREVSWRDRQPLL